MLVDARLYARLKNTHRALGFSEPLSKLDFELCAPVRHGRNPGNHVARHQAKEKSVRVVKNDRVGDRQVKGCGGRHRCGHGTPSL